MGFAMVVALLAPGCGAARETPKSVVRIEKESTHIMTNEEASKLYETYVSAWKAVSAEERTRIANEVISDHVHYSTPRHEQGGRATIVEDMETFQSKFPGGHFEVGDVSAHHGAALLTWVLVQADGTVFARGHDEMRVSPDGKIVSLTTFAPSVPR